MNLRPCRGCFADSYPPSLYSRLVNMETVAPVSRLRGHVFRQKEVVHLPSDSNSSPRSSQCPQGLQRWSLLLDNECRHEYCAVDRIGTESALTPACKKRAIFHVFDVCMLGNSRRFSDGVLRRLTRNFGPQSFSMVVSTPRAVHD